MSMLSDMAGGLLGGGSGSSKGIQATSGADTTANFGSTTYVMPSAASMAPTVPASGTDNTTLLIGGAIVAVLLVAVLRK